MDQEYYAGKKRWQYAEKFFKKKIDQYGIDDANDDE